MSTILLNFGVHTRNWPRIDFQPVEFNSEFYFGDLGGGGGGAAFFRVPAKSQNCRSQDQAQNLFEITKNRSK